MPSLAAKTVVLDIEQICVGFVWIIGFREINQMELRIRVFDFDYYYHSVFVFYCFVENVVKF